MAGDGRKRARAEAAEEPAGPPAKRLGGSQALAEVERELASINELLQTEETSQKQTWQIGKRVKKILDGHPELPTAKQLDAFFLWGTALARLASLNEDPTLAEAAADKFQQMHELSGGDEAAFGPVGFTLWGSSLMIVATETRDRAVLDKALAKFEQAVDVDGGTTFESRFQYAKSLKEGGDLLRFLEDGGGHEVANEYYQKALAVCDELEKIYERESSKEVESDTKKDSSNDNDESGNDEDVDEDDDIVTVADYAEVKLLEAILQGTLESSDWATRFERTLALFYKALELSPNNPEALMELTNYLARRCVMASKMPAKERPAISWQPLFDDLESKFCSALLDVEFPIEECHEICVRCDTVADFEPDMDGIDVSIPHMLNSLGKGLAAFLRAFPDGEAGASEASEKKKVKPRGIAQKKKLQKQKQQENPRFVHAVEVLRSAHHLHDKLGAYHLSCLFASPAFLDEQKSREWLETASSYGALEDDFDPEDFGDVVRARPWFQKFLQPEEMLDESELAQQ